MAIHLALNISRPILLDMGVNIWRKEDYICTAEASVINHGSLLNKKLIICFSEITRYHLYTQLLIYNKQ